MDQTRGMTSTRRSQAFWQKLVTEVERRVAVTAVAERHGVKPRTLGWWCWRLRRKDASSESPRLLPVVVHLAATTYRGRRRTSDHLWVWRRCGPRDDSVGIHQHAPPDDRKLEGGYLLCIDQGIYGGPAQGTCSVLGLTEIARNERKFNQ